MVVSKSHLILIEVEESFGLGVMAGAEVAELSNTTSKRRMAHFYLLSYMQRNPRIIRAINFDRADDFVWLI